MNCLSLSTSSASSAGDSCQKKPKLLSMHSWVFLRSGTLFEIVERLLLGLRVGFAVGISSIFLHRMQLKAVVSPLARISAH